MKARAGTPNGARGRAGLRALLQRCALVCAALNVALVVLLISPWSPSRARAELRLGVVTAQSTALHRRVEALLALRRGMERGQAQANEIVQQEMPAERPADYVVLRELQSIAQRTGAHTGTITLVPAPKSQLGLRQLAIQMSIAGDYANLVEFLNGIERSPLFFIIDQVSLSPRNASTKTAAAGSLALSVVLETYVQAGPESPAPDARSGKQGTL